MPTTGTSRPELPSDRVSMFYDLNDATSAEYLAILADGLDR